MQDDILPSYAQRTMIEYRFPRVVEMAVPLEGFSMAMEAFHRSRDILRRFGRPTRRGNTEYCRWCFAHPAHAMAFRAQFGGEMLPVESWAQAQ
jgi:hypothetical protein